MTSLTVVIPAYNVEDWIGPTLSALDVALLGSKWTDAEVVVVNDGSTDGTSAAARNAEISVPLQVIDQENQGRLLTRKVGIDKAAGEFVLLLDSRVFMTPSSLQFVYEQVTDHPDRLVWNGHIEIERRGNPYARFWHAVTRLAWRRYLSKPQLTSFSLEEFDYFPKGTGCFLAPRTVLLDGYSRFTSMFSDPKLASDDTALIRNINENFRIFLSPDFASTYNSRTTLKGFLHHVFVRGIHFPDSFLRPGTRFFAPLIAFLLATPIAGLFLIMYPSLLLAVPIGIFAVIVLALRLGIGWKDVLALAVLLPLFVPAYAAGIWTGTWLGLVSWLTSRR